MPQIGSSMRSKPLLGGASPRHHALGHRRHQRPRGFWYPILAGRILRATRALAPGLPCNNSSSALLRRLIPRKISYPAAKRHARGPPELAGNREISGARRNPGPACSRPMTGTPKSYGSDHPGAWSGPRRNVNGEEGDSNGHNASSQGSRGVDTVGLNRIPDLANTGLPRKHKESCLLHLSGFCVPASSSFPISFRPSARAALKNPLIPLSEFSSAAQTANQLTNEIARKLALAGSTLTGGRSLAKNSLRV